MQAAQIGDLTPAQRIRCEREVTAALAGMVAEKMACGRWDTSGGGHDVRNADDILRVLSSSNDECAPYFTLLATRAQVLLRRRWPYVVAVAEALVAKKKLAASEIQQAIVDTLNRLMEKARMSRSGEKP